MRTDPVDGRPLEDAPLERLFGLAARLVNVAWSRRLEQHGLTPAGLHVLFALARAGGLTSGDVAAATFCTPATLTGIVDTLERDGLVTRRRDERDRRVVRLRLTEEGRVRMQAVSRSLEETTQLFDYVDPSDEPAVRRFLIEAVERCRTSEEGER